MQNFSPIGYEKYNVYILIINVDSSVMSHDIYLRVILQYPDSKVHGANMGPIWGWQDPGGSHVGPMNFAI